MYNHVWEKYLPIIKILLKKSFAEQQTLSLNRLDFERGGAARKAAAKFKIELSGGKVSNIISSSVLATQLAQLMLEDDSIKAILQEHDFQINLNSRFELIIREMSK